MLVNGYDPDPGQGPDEDGAAQRHRARLDRLGRLQHHRPDPAPARRLPGRGPDRQPQRQAADRAGPPAQGALRRGRRSRLLSPAEGRPSRH